MTSLSRPARNSLALRPVWLQSRPCRNLSPRLLNDRLLHRIARAATEVYRKFLGRILHLLARYAFAWRTDCPSYEAGFVK